MNKIDYKNLTEEEAQAMLDCLCASFSVTAKCYGLDNKLDVSFLMVAGPYDDNFHTKFSKNYTHIESLCNLINEKLKYINENKQI